MKIVSPLEPAEYKALADKEDNIPIDYIITGSVKNYALERKRLPDVVASATSTDGRLWEQLKTLEQLREQGYIPILVMEGTAWELLGVPNITLKTWRGIETGIASYRIGQVRVEDFKQFAKLLEILEEKAGKSSSYTRPTIIKAHRTKEEEKEDVLKAIKGIGNAKAKAILAEFSTLKKVVEGANNNDNTLKKILGNNYDHFLEIML